MAPFTDRLGPQLRQQFVLVPPATDVGMCRSTWNGLEEPFWPLFLEQL